MTAIHFRATLVVAALVFQFATGASAQAAAPAATGPWVKVPALTTACYSKGDPFVPRLAAAQATALTDLERQQATNTQISEEFQNIDPMEKAKRMQQWMMSNPQEATKFMQMAQQGGPVSVGDSDTSEAQKNALDNEFAALSTRLNAALAQAFAPSTARWGALQTKLGVAEKRTVIELDPGDGASAADVAELKAIRVQRDQEYQALCPQWFGAAGEVPVHLKKYKTWLVQQRIPNTERVDAVNVQSYAIMNTPAASYRSTATLQGVVDHLSRVEGGYMLRPETPRCGPTGPGGC